MIAAYTTRWSCSRVYTTASVFLAVALLIVAGVGDCCGVLGPVQSPMVGLMVYIQGVALLGSSRAQWRFRLQRLIPAVLHVLIRTQASLQLSTPVVRGTERILSAVFLVPLHFTAPYLFANSVSHAMLMTLAVLWCKVWYFAVPIGYAAFLSEAAVDLLTLVVAVVVYHEVLLAQSIYSRSAKRDMPDELIENILSLPDEQVGRGATDVRTDTVRSDSSGREVVQDEVATLSELLRAYV